MEKKRYRVAPPTTTQVFDFSFDKLCNEMLVRGCTPKDIERVLDQHLEKNKGEKVKLEGAPETSKEEHPIADNTTYKTKNEETNGGIRHQQESPDVAEGPVPTA